MLSKKQLRDINNNSVSWNLKDAAQTALAYRAMLEECYEYINRIAYENDGLPSGRRAIELCKELAALLKESEGEEG